MTELLDLQALLCSPKDRDAAIVRLAKQGVAPAEIDWVFKGFVPRPSIYKAIADARRRGETIPHFPKTGGKSRGRVVHLPDDLIASLKPHAARRKVSVQDLIRSLLWTVVDEPPLLDNVLDDLDDLGDGR